jgi:hypothetical protein
MNREQLFTQILSSIAIRRTGDRRLLNPNATRASNMDAALARAALVQDVVPVSQGRNDA